MTMIVEKNLNIYKGALFVYNKAGSCTAIPLQFVDPEIVPHEETNYGANFSSIEQKEYICQITQYYTLYPKHNTVPELARYSVSTEMYLVSDLVHSDKPIIDQPLLREWITCYRMPRGYLRSFEECINYLGSWVIEFHDINEPCQILKSRTIKTLKVELFTKFATTCFKATLYKYGTPRAKVTYTTQHGVQIEKIRPKVQRIEEVDIYLPTLNLPG